MSLQDVAGRPRPAAEFKGSVFTFTVLLIRRFELDEIAADVRARVAQAPQFFLNAPVVLDLAQVSGQADADLPSLAALLRAEKLVPVAVCNGDEAHNAAALAAGLALLQRSGARRTPLPSAKPAAVAEPVAAEAPAGPAAKGARVVTQPVRSGQQIYARGGDLIVLAAVNPGAEVIADGNIHVYAPLRGRALAGVLGDGNARIFSLNFGPEMVAIAGTYRVFEEPPPAQLHGKPVQVALDGEKLLLTALI